MPEAPLLKIISLHGGQQKKGGKLLQRLQYLQNSPTSPIDNGKFVGKLLNISRNVGIAKDLNTLLSLKSQVRRSRIDIDGHDSKLLRSSAAASQFLPLKEEPQYVVKLEGSREPVTPLCLVEKKGVTADTVKNCNVFASYVVKDRRAEVRHHGYTMEGELILEFELSSPKDGEYSRLEFCVDLYHDSDTKDKSIKILDWDPKCPNSLQPIMMTRSRSSELSVNVAVSQTSPIGGSAKRIKGEQFQSSDSTIKVDDRIDKRAARWILSPLRDGELFEMRRLAFRLLINHSEYPLPLTAKVSLQIDIKDLRPRKSRILFPSFLRKFSEPDDQGPRVLKVPETTIRFVSGEKDVSADMKWPNIPGILNFGLDMKPTTSGTPTESSTDLNQVFLVSLSLLFLFVLFQL
ncbi:hypothetical protein GYMLUDRAFT_101171 [Collybiopsis luxurians FD-317 M1]|uniref:Uncharacterized protein n=1 Tax=Collybiopsis luxurians FD-317 M1 TaxID=944289 RepID=A0A0D0BNJ5_9AGAR|nr:hypothetical protein GYMLUDRAFT_101171 [Collybiopsis luxurians FD-317 M1]